jgi:hypothetical protein
MANFDFSHRYLGRRRLLLLGKLLQNRVIFDRHAHTYLYHQYSSKSKHRHVALSSCFNISDGYRYPQNIAILIKFW